MGIIPGSMTPRQRQLFEVIRHRIDTDGVAPSFAEMQAGANIRSKSSVHRLLGCLEARGVIRRIPGRARAIEIVSRDDREAENRRALLRLADLTGALCETFADHAGPLGETFLALRPAVEAARAALGRPPLVIAVNTNTHGNTGE